MRLLIHGQHHELTPIRIFRAHYHLPDSFGVAQFEPKDFSGLGRLDQSPGVLARIEAEVLAAVPVGCTPSQWVDDVGRIVAVFEQALWRVNDMIGLRPAELGFAVAGLQNVLDDYAYAAVRSELLHQALPSFESIYYTWLNESVRVSAKAHEYIHQGNTWQIQVITFAFGRIGLQVTTMQETHYLLDMVYACPADGFMQAFASAIVNRLRQPA